LNKLEERWKAKDRELGAGPGHHHRRHRAKVVPVALVVVAHILMIIIKSWRSKSTFRPRK
jgi:hypothetical protein